MSQVHALIVDDDAKNVNVLSMLLDEQGVSATRLTNSVRIDSVLDSIDRVDVVFLDLEMPGLDGYDVLGILTKHRVLVGNIVPVSWPCSGDGSAARA